MISTPVAVAGPSLVTTTVNTITPLPLGLVRAGGVGTTVFESDSSATNVVVVEVEVLVLIDELLEVLVEVLVELLVVSVVEVTVDEVVAVAQSWKQQEQDVDATPPICVQVVTSFTATQCGGVGNWQVRRSLPHDVAAWQLCSSPLHVALNVLDLWAMQFWKLPRSLPVQVSAVQHWDWMALRTEQRCDRQASVSPLNVVSGEIVSQEHTWIPSCRHRRRTCRLHAGSDRPVVATQAEMAAPHCSRHSVRRLASAGGASPPKRAMVTTSARRAVRQHGFASDMVTSREEPENSANRVSGSRERAPLRSRAVEIPTPLEAGTPAVASAAPHVPPSWRAMGGC